MTYCPLCLKLIHPPAAEVVWEFPCSIAFLGPWQHYAGYCVLVAKAHARELFDLDRAERQAFLDEMTTLAAAIARAFAPRKLNCELLGNQVPHPHWHLFPRSEADPEKLKPVWLALERAEQDPVEKRRLEGDPQLRAATIRRLQAALGA